MSGNTVSKQNKEAIPLYQIVTDQIGGSIRQSADMLARWGYESQLGGDPFVQEDFIEQTQDYLKQRKFQKLGLKKLREEDYKLLPESMDAIFELTDGLYSEWEDLNDEAMPSALEIDAIYHRSREAQHIAAINAPNTLTKTDEAVEHTKPTFVQPFNGLAGIIRSAGGGSKAQFKALREKLTAPNGSSMSQADLAEFLGVSLSTAGNWENENMADNPPNYAWYLIKQTLGYEDAPYLATINGGSKPAITININNQYTAMRDDYDKALEVFNQTTLEAQKVSKAQYRAALVLIQKAEQGRAEFDRVIIKTIDEYAQD